VAFKVLQGLLPALAPVAKSEKARENLQIATAVVEAVKLATGATSSEQAIQMVATDPSKRLAADKAVAERLADVMPLVETMEKLEAARFEAEEKSRAGARGFAATMLAFNDWRGIGFGALLALLSLLVIGGSGLVLWQVMALDWATEATKAGIVEVFKNILVLVIGYFFGSSSDSRRKTQMLSEMGK
jgi:hypothetical protein